MSTNERIRILLDTCVVRAIIHNSPPLLDIAHIRANLDSLAITIPDTAVVELTSRLQDGAIAFYDWERAIPQIDQIRDREWPVLPSGTVRAMWSGLVPPEPAVLTQAQRHSVAVWKMFQYADEKTKLDHTVVYRDGDQTSMIKSDPLVTETLKQAVRKGWSDFVDKCVQHFTGTNPRREEVQNVVLAATRDAFGGDTQRANQIDLFAKAIARKVHMATNSANPYNPDSDKNRGDMFDLMLLMTLGTPLIVVTEDHRFLNGLDEIDSPQRKQVISIAQFNDHLANGTLSSLLPG